MSTTELIEQAMQLPIKDRTLIVTTLIETLTAPDALYEESILEEAQRRSDDVRQGLMEDLSKEEFFAGIDLKK
ncbi:MAG: addiction module protein [Bacteroidia bacterium]|nr:addiction module protein [Bacteroidia bacterium]